MNWRASFLWLLLTLQACTPACPAPPTSVLEAASESTRKLALKKQSLHMCDQSPDFAPPDCHALVEKKFEGCVGPLVRHETGTEEYVACLGFKLPPSPAKSEVVEECEQPHVRAKVEIAIARAEPWGDATTRLVRDQTWYVARTPVATGEDARSVRLLRSGGDKLLELKWTPAGQEKMAAATRANVGGFALSTVNGETSVARILEPVLGDSFSLRAATLMPRDVCERSP